MWAVAMDSGNRKTSMSSTSVEVLVEPREGDVEHVGVVGITVPPGATMPAHEHGDSDGILIAVSGELLVNGAGGRVERLRPGVVAVVPAHERVGIENPTDAPATVLACFAPPTFVQQIAASRATAAAGD